MSRGEIIATAAALVTATGLLVATLMREGKGSVDGEKMANLAVTLGEHSNGLADAEIKLHELVREDADDEQIVAAVSEMNRHGRALAVLSSLFGGRGAMAPVLDFRDARDAIMTAVPKIEDETAKAWVLHQAESMERRAMMAIAFAHEAEGKAKITFNHKDEGGETLVNGVPLKEWFLALKQKEEK